MTPKTTELAEKIMAKECRHLKGTWVRQGRFTAIVCACKEHMTVIDVDSDAAFNLFEGGESAIQLFEKDLKPVPGDDAEAYQVNFLDKGFNPKAALEDSSKPNEKGREKRV